LPYIRSLHLIVFGCHLMSKRGTGRGRKVIHKGGGKHFSDEQEIIAQQEDIRKQKIWRDNHPGEETVEAEAAERPSGAVVAPTRKPKSDSDSSEESEDEDGKHKGITHLIDIENPNRVKQKTKKVTDLEVEDTKPQLSRREREAIEKEQAKAYYDKLHAEGKTDEAQADLARLAIIKKQRQEAALKREEEKKTRDAQDAVKKGKDDERKKLASGGSIEEKPKKNK